VAVDCGKEMLAIETDADTVVSGTLFSEAPFNMIVAATVQFDATAYVPVRESVVITPLWDAVSSAVNVPVVESNVTWLTVVGCPALSVPPWRNP
jgi:hypothetical protein